MRLVADCDCDYDYDCDCDCDCDCECPSLRLLVVRDGIGETAVGVLVTAEGADAATLSMRPL